jgi:hypothetical protein
MPAQSPVRVTKKEPDIYDIDLEAIRSAGVKIGVDPLGGAAAAYWQPLAERYGIDITVVNPKIDPTFAFMTLDHDGKIRPTDHDETHARSRQRRFDRRVEGRLSQRLVRCAPLGHGEHLQALCREPEKRRPSRRHCRAGAGDRQPLTPGEVNGVLRVLRVTPEIATASENTHPWTSVTYTRVV